MEITSPQSNQKLHRSGFSILELQVSFLILSLALAGLAPLTIMQSRHLQKLGARFDDQSTYYLVPKDSTWARKLGAQAGVDTVDPGPLDTPAVTLIDNNDSGYSEDNSSGWHTHFRSDSHQQRHRCSGYPRRGDVANWEFSNLRPGWYEVFVTHHDGRWMDASNAPYSIYDDERYLQTVRVNQRVPPSGPLFAGSRWKSLGTISIASDTLRVSLSDNANGLVDADAVRIVPVRNDIFVLSNNRSTTNENVTVNVYVRELTP